MMTYNICVEEALIFCYRILGVWNVSSVSKMGNKGTFKLACMALQCSQSKVWIEVRKSSNIHVIRFLPQ
jgi:hypothetical protein